MTKLHLARRSPTLWFCVLVIAANLVLPSTNALLPPVEGQDRDLLRAATDEDKVLAKAFAAYASAAGPLRPGTTVMAPVELGPPPPPDRPVSEFDQLRDAVCKTDAIVTGQGRKSRVRFNIGETYLFTVYDFRVDRWLRPAKSGIEGWIRAALPGGEAVIDGQRTAATPAVPLEDNRAVMLWLTETEIPNVYTLASQVGVVSSEGRRILTSQPTRLELFRRQESMTDLLVAIGNASATCGR